MLINQIHNFSGIFAPVSKIAKPGSAPRPRSPAVSPHKSPVQRSGSVDVSNVKARVDTGKYYQIS